jgi:hypothetical protein
MNSFAKKPFVMHRILRYIKTEKFQFVVEFVDPTYTEGIEKRVLYELDLEEVDANKLIHAWSMKCIMIQDDFFIYHCPNGWAFWTFLMENPGAVYINPSTSERFDSYKRLVKEN